jgi:hypothetical protein
MDFAIACAYILVMVLADIGLSQQANYPRYTILTKIACLLSMPFVLPLVFCAVVLGQQEV